MHSQEENFRDFWFPSTSLYPYFLFPGNVDANHELEPEPGSDPEFDNPNSYPNSGREGGFGDPYWDPGHDLHENKVDDSASHPSSFFSSSSSSFSKHEREHDGTDNVHRHRHNHVFNPAQPSPFAQPAPTPSVDESHPAPSDPALGTRNLAPRPAYDRSDHDLDNHHEFNIASIPDDRYFELDVFEGFVDQGS